MSFLLRPTTRMAPTLARSFSSTRASQLARMTVVGRLAATPEEVEIPNRTIVRFALGTSVGRGENKKTSWFRVASFQEGPGKELLMGLQKGSLLYVEADARMDNYEDKEGKTQSSLSLIANKFEVLSRPRQDFATNDEGLVQEEAAR